MSRKHKLTNPRGVFLQARASAERRGIPWRLTFDEWWRIWEPHWSRRANEYLAMCRTGDKGAYEVGNVRIDTQDANTEEYRQACARRNARAESAQLLTGTFDARVARFERRILHTAIRKYGTLTAAAKALGMTFRAMRYQRNKHSL